MTTLKDIALRCGVTPTVVSAVLNHRKGTVCCSEEKRRLIEKTAAELQYRGNIMARSMVQQRIPIAALMFHRPDSWGIAMDRYFSGTASDLNFQLLRHDLESLLAFYRDEEEQIRRFQFLVRTGLIGGVISNLIPGHNASFIRELQSSGVPYVLLGTPQIPAVACRIEEGLPPPLVRELLRHTHAKNFYLHRMDSGKHLLALYREGSPAEWDIPAAPELTEDPENLILSYGVDFYAELRHRMKVANPAVSERKGFEHLIPPGVPYLLISNENLLKRSLMAASLLADWMKHGVVPAPDTITIPMSGSVRLFL